ncbi:hypothetical protein HZA99_00895 [Candidatus Woesearchaeota archaeon]|nr:hypothetical protein [Candidatus Woesearchaeota archaeon]
MSFMDKLKFWKKEEDKFAELDAQLGTLQTTPGKTPGTETQPTGLESSNYADMDEIMRSRNIAMETDTQESAGAGFTGFTSEHPAEQRRPSMQAQQSYEVVQPQQGSSGNLQQQLELVSAKLDTIRVSLESINHRLVSLEHAMHVQDYEEIEPRRRRGVW